MQASNIVPFMFEASAVRVIMSSSGAPWFVGVDVCNALGLANSRDALARLDADEKGVANADTPGGTQQVVMVSEPGVYRLVFTSRVESAERFKRWLAHDVIPAIRKTGAYVAPVATPSPALPAEVVGRMAAVATVQASVAMLAGLVPGLRHGMIGAISLDAVQRATGQDVSDLRKLLPAADGTLASMNPTALGKALGLSAPKANALLASKGLQKKNARGEWELTEEGQKVAEAIPYTRGSHSGYQLLWRPEVLVLLK